MSSEGHYIEVTERMSEKKDNTRAKIPPEIAIVRRQRLSTDFFVGAFMLLSCLAGAWLAVGLGDIRFFNSDTYDLYAEFDNISGLKKGASVEIAGVPIGEVRSIDLKDPVAKVTLRIRNGVQIRDDDIISVRTKGIIGDRYVKVSRGASEAFIAPGGTITETESVIDIEDLVGKLVHSMSSGESVSSGESKSDGE